MPRSQKYLANRMLKDHIEQCCGSGSGIRCFFDLWIRDGKNPEPGSGIRDEHPGSYVFENLVSIFWSKILKFFEGGSGFGIRDHVNPGSGMGKNRIRDQG